MPTNRPRPNETREMRLFGRVIRGSRLAPDLSLPEFIARRRQPGSDEWRTWDELRYELTEISGEIVTDQTIRGWAKRYGIPEDTERHAADGGTSPETYAEILNVQDITIS